MMDYEFNEKLLIDDLEVSRLELQVIAAQPVTIDRIAEKHWIRSRISDLEMRLMQLRADRKLDTILEKLEEYATDAKRKLAALEK